MGFGFPRNPDAKLKWRPQPEIVQRVLADRLGATTRHQGVTMDTKIIRLPQVREMVGFGTTTIYDKMKKGEFPKQIKLGRMSGWLESEIKAWIQEQAEKRLG